MDVLLKIIKKGFFQTMFDEDIAKGIRIFIYTLVMILYTCVFIVLIYALRRRETVAGEIALAVCLAIVAAYFIWFNTRMLLFLKKKKKEQKQKEAAIYSGRLPIPVMIWTDRKAKYSNTISPK